MLLQESEEMIADLSCKVENLKLEMANLKQSLSQPGRGGEGKGVGLMDGACIMFTRLDAERNTRTLQEVLHKERCIRLIEIFLA